MDNKMFLKENNLHCDSKRNKDSSRSDFDLRMGIRSWRPDCLQRFNTMIWFMITLGLASITQGCLAGITMVSIPAIQKEFGFTSKLAGIIVGGYNVSAPIAICIVSYFGSKGNKPKWIGTGAILTGFGALLFALPKLMIGDYQPMRTYQMELDMCAVNKTMSNSLCTETSMKSNLKYFVVFFVAEIIMGAGTTPFLTLGPAYIDENVSPKSSPIYIGISHTSLLLGFAIGFPSGGSFLDYFTNINLPEGMMLRSNDPRWIGAWWLGFVSFFGVMIISGALLFLFPKKMMKKGQLKRNLSIQEGQLPSLDGNIQYTVKGLLIQSLRILRNKAFVLTILAVSVKLLYIFGLVTFVAKILILKFGVSHLKASLFVTAIYLPGVILGTMAGSFLMRKLKVITAAKTGVKICAIIGIISAASAFIWVIPGCKNTNLSGVVVPYHNRTSVDGLQSMCNSKCSCSVKQYLPICGSDGKTYHSPCYAGCTVALPGNKKLPYFGNCACIPQKVSSQFIHPDANDTSHPLTSIMEQNKTMFNLNNMTKQQKIQMMAQSLYNKATTGPCDRGCKNLYYMAVLMSIMILISLFSAIPHKFAVMRSVPDNLRSFALGMEFVVIRVLSFLPGPIILGAVLDTECITWGYNACGKRQHCYDYNIDELSWNIAIFGCVTSAVSAILYGLAWWFYPTANTCNKRLLTSPNEEEK